MHHDPQCPRHHIVQQGSERVERDAEIGQQSLALVCRKVLESMRAHWAGLPVFVEHPEVPLDNNAAERALRTVAVGRKNWLFAGSDDGGERAASIYSILGTASLNGLNPEGYLQYVLQHIPEHPINRIDELLPWNVAGQVPALRLAA